MASQHANSPALALMPHQEEGVAFLLDRKAALLAFEQGLGKTLVAITAFERLLASGAVEAMLVVCPSSLKRNWLNEVGKFAPNLTCEIVEGAPAQRRSRLGNTGAQVVIVSYETARIEVAGILALLSRRIAVLVLDESQQVKNRLSLSSIAVQHFAPRCEFRWLLSGTPVPNSAIDLYAQTLVIRGGKELGRRDLFEAADSDDRAAQRVRTLVDPVILRRTKSECLDLPEKQLVDVRVELPAWQRRLYNDLRDDFVGSMRGMSRKEFRSSAPTILSRLMRLTQVATNPALVFPVPEDPAKFVHLDALLETLAGKQGEKVIIWTQFTQTVETLLRRYRAWGSVGLYGQVPIVDRQLVVDRFQRDPSCRVLIGNPAAGGTGFTLTSARYAIYESLSWRFDHFAQSQDRIHRIGQTRPVSCSRLVAVDTIEEVIVEALARKARVARALLGDRAGFREFMNFSPEEFSAMLVENRLPR